MTSKIFKLYIGYNNKHTHTQLIETNTLTTRLLNDIDNFFIGYNYNLIDGRWKGEAEKTLVIEIWGTENDRETVIQLSHLLARKYEQEAIGYNELDAVVDFIS